MIQQQQNALQLKVWIAFVVIELLQWGQTVGKGSAVWATTLIGGGITWLTTIGTGWAITIPGAMAGLTTTGWGWGWGGYVAPYAVELLYVIGVFVGGAGLDTEYLCALE